jgi:cell division protein FtsW (lipid II flippase)
MTGANTHETFDRTEEVQQSSNRGFGVVFAVVFALIAAYQWRHAGAWPYWAGAAAAILLVSLLAPGTLAPMARLWMRLALALSKVMTPVIMAVIFFGSVLPTGFLMRLFGKDPLRLKWHEKDATYWIARTPEGPAPESFTRQF